MIGNTRPISSTTILDQMKKCGITHIVCLPSSEMNFFYDTLLNQKDITLIPVCREGEAIGIAFGLLLGGKKPVLLHQNTGLFESGDSIKGLALELGLPILFLMTCKGWRKDGNHFDAAAYYTEPVLDSWGIKHYLVQNDAEAELIPLAYKEAFDKRKPVAVLIATEELDHRANAGN